MNMSLMDACADGERKLTKLEESWMTITLSDDEATILCGLIEDEQNCVGYEQDWTKDQRELFDEIVWKLKNGFGT